MGYDSMTLVGPNLHWSKDPWHWCPNATSLPCTNAARFFTTFVLSSASLLSQNNKQVFTEHQNDLHSELDACFTPNAEYVLSGSEDSGIYVWRADDGKLAKVLKGHSSPVGRVLCSPKYEVIASACTNTALWIDAGLEAAP